jgi:hypothetical protein
MGAVTLSKANFGAHKWYGNPTGSTATPGANFLTDLDLPFQIPLSQLNGGTAPSGQSYNFSGVNLLQARVASNLTTSVNGDFGYDSNNKNWLIWGNGQNNYILISPVSGPTDVNGDCAQISVSGTVLTVIDSGKKCNFPQIEATVNIPSTTGSSFTTLCSTNCSAVGQYEVDWNMWYVSDTCSSGETEYTFGLSWTDENGTSHSVSHLPMMTSAGSGGNTVLYGSGSGAWMGGPGDVASNSFPLSSNGSTISYQIGDFTGCPGGTTVIGVRITVLKTQ